MTAPNQKQKPRAKSKARAKGTPGWAGQKQRQGQKARREWNGKTEEALNVRSATGMAALWFDCFAGRRRRLVRATLGGAVEAKGHRDGGALRVEQILLAGAETQLDQSAGVGEDLGLPVVVALEAGECVAGGLVPFAGGVALEVALADQRVLNLKGAGLVDGLLAVEAGFAAPGSSPRALGCATAGHGGRVGRRDPGRSAERPGASEGRS